MILQLGETAVMSIHLVLAETDAALFVRALYGIPRMCGTG